MKGRRISSLPKGCQHAESAVHSAALRLVPLPVEEMLELPRNALRLLLICAVLASEQGNVFTMTRREKLFEWICRVKLFKARKQLLARGLLERARPYRRGASDRWRLTWLDGGSGGGT